MLHKPSSNPFCLFPFLQEKLPTESGSRPHRDHSRLCRHLANSVSWVHEQEQVTRRGVLVKDLLRSAHQAIETVFHPRGRGAQEDPYVGKVYHDFGAFQGRNAPAARMTSTSTACRLPTVAEQCLRWATRSLPEPPSMRSARRPPLQPTWLSPEPPSLRPSVPGCPLLGDPSSDRRSIEKFLP